MIEALVALLVLAAAGLAAVRLEPRILAGADAARLGAEAMFLAQLDLEQARGFGSTATPGSTTASVTSDQGVANSTVSSAATVGDMTGFRLVRTVTADADGFVRDKALSVRVDWTDRAGSAQHLALDTLIAGADPSLSGALWVARTAPASLPVDGRAPGIPGGSRRLGDGTSLLALSAAGSTVVRVDDRDGVVVAVCPADLAARAAVTPFDLATCTPAHGLLLSGHVRFDGAAAPDALLATHAAQPLEVRLTLTAGGDPARPPVCAADVDTTGDGVSYRCAVYTGTGRPAWSGSSSVVPVGWTIGPAPGQRKVCRDSTDQDGSGAVDQNAEHPATYTAVTENLTQQNFLVVRGDVACPMGTMP